MLTHRKRRLYFILLLLVSISLAIALVLYALRQNINLYYTPQQVHNQSIAKNKTFRLGGMVVPGSIHHATNGLEVSFILTDYSAQVKVYFNGLLPSLFRAGQGIVAEGKLNQNGEFIASQVLAKHDANYRPPNIKKQLGNDI